MGLGREQREVNLQQIQAEEIKSILYLSELDFMSGYDAEDYSPELIEAINNFIKSKEDDR